MLDPKIAALMESTRQRRRDAGFAVTLDTVAGPHERACASAEARAVVVASWERRGLRQQPNGRWARPDGTPAERTPEGDWC